MYICFRRDHICGDSRPGQGVAMLPIPAGPMYREHFSFVPREVKCVSSEWVCKCVCVCVCVCTVSRLWFGTRYPLPLSPLASSPSPSQFSLPFAFPHSIRVSSRLPPQSSPACLLFPPSVPPSGLSRLSACRPAAAHLRVTIYTLRYATMVIQYAIWWGRACVKMACLWPIIHLDLCSTP